MTLDELKEKPLKRNEMLLHGTVGLVLYCSKVRYHPEEIQVRRCDLEKTDPKARIRVPISHVTRHSPAGKKQGTALLLCHCESCGLKIRTTRNWLALGTPRCFNMDCSSMKQSDGAGAELVIEWGEYGDGKLGTDMAEMMRQQRVDEGGKSRADPTDNPHHGHSNDDELDDGRPL